MHEEFNTLIENAAIYLRKSRGDLETDLAKHRLTLTEMCEQRNINYQEYAEIGSSDSIHDRPVFSQLLIDIEKGLYDAVAVIDIDRLGRGDDQDWGYIEQILRENEVYIVTPTKVYDWDNDADEFQIDAKKFFARIEYKTITRRLRNGKIAGAKQGKWTNGKPPYPYVYNKITQQLDIDGEHYKVYRQIIDMAISGIPANKIAWELNKLDIKSPGGSYWSSNAVYRILKDQTHLGKVVFAKQKGSGHKNRKTKPLKIFDERDWVIVDGQHQPIKTLEEHTKILELLEKRRLIPKAARRGAYILSGLMYCGKCGYRMGITLNGKSKLEFIKKCQHHDPIGIKCDNSGVDSSVIEQAIFQELEKYENDIISNLEDINGSETELLKISLKEKQEEIFKNDKALENLLIMREDGEISKDIYLKRKKIREETIIKIKNEIDKINERIYMREQSTNKKKLNNIREFRKLWENTDSTESKNQFLKTIIDRIYYTRNGDNIEVKINFL